MSCHLQIATVLLSPFQFGLGILPYNCIQVHASKIMLKIQARLQQYMNQQLSDVQTGFRREGGTRDQTAIICWNIDKPWEFEKKTSTSASLTMLKALAV